MNISLATFMKIALTAVVVLVLMFGVAYSVIDSKTSEYEEQIGNTEMPSTNGPFTP